MSRIGYPSIRLIPQPLDGADDAEVFCSDFVFRFLVIKHNSIPIHTVTQGAKWP